MHGGHEDNEDSNKTTNLIQSSCETQEARLGEPLAEAASARDSSMSFF